MGLDEPGTLARLRAHRRELIDPKIAEHKGRIVKTTCSKTRDGIAVPFAQQQHTAHADYDQPIPGGNAACHRSTTFPEQKA